MWIIWEIGDINVRNMTYKCEKYDRYITEWWEIWKICNTNMINVRNIIYECEKYEKHAIKEWETWKIRELWGIWQI